MASVGKRGRHRDNDSVEGICGVAVRSSPAQLNLSVASKYGSGDRVGLALFFAYGVQFAFRSEPAADARLDNYQHEPGS